MDILLLLIKVEHPMITGGSILYPDSCVASLYQLKKSDMIQCAWSREV